MSTKAVDKEGLKAEMIENEEYFDVDFPYFRVVAIIVSVALGLLDMMFLYQAIHAMTGLGNGASMFAAFAIAEVANFSAFMMGYTNGKHLSQHAVNRKSAGYFVFWIILGLVYTAIRVSNFITRMNNPELELNLFGEIFQFAILAISFIGTGSTIWSSARAVFDKRCADYRKTKKAFEMARENLTNAHADLQENYGNILNFDVNFKNLDLQKKKIEQSISRAEKATMSDIVGKVLSNNPGTNPATAREVMKDVLAQRKEEEEEVL